MKVGLITIYQVPNYGSVLQAFASQKVLEQMGHECIVIRYNYRNDDFFTKQGLKRNKFKEWQLNSIPWLKSAKLHRFRKENLNFSKQFETYQELVEFDWSTFDAFIVGSDQVWNTRFLFADPAFLLKFVPDNKPKISLSSSFAMKEMPSKYFRVFHDELNKFSAISVREDNGVSIIMDCLKLDKDVKVTLDPTLLLSKEQWLKLISRSSFKKKRPYILLYMWTYAFEPRPYILRVIEYYQKKMNADVIVLEGHRELAGLNCRFVDANNSSVQKFIDLFANADLVITSSFHGTAFAINFGVPLISIVPNEIGDDRQSSLLKKLGAGNSIIKIGTEIDKIDPDYSVSFVFDSLRNERVKTLNWLHDSLL